MGPLGFSAGDILSKIVTGANEVAKTVDKVIEAGCSYTDKIPGTASYAEIAKTACSTQQLSTGGGNTTATSSGGGAGWSPGGVFAAMVASSPGAQAALQAAAAAKASGQDPAAFLKALTESQDKPWYKNWKIWAGVGAVAAVGTTGVVLLRWRGGGRRRR